MADIFLSYASEDRDRIAPIVAALEHTGRAVFWDRKTPVGVAWDTHIEQNLQQAECVVVVWSRFSIDKDWVKIEARHGLGRHCLAPARIDPVTPPFGFDHVQFADLSAWSGDIADPEWRELVGAVERLVPQAAEATPQTPPDATNPGVAAPIDLSAYWQQLLQDPTAAELQQLADEVAALRATHPSSPELKKLQRNIIQALDSAEGRGARSPAKASRPMLPWAIAGMLCAAVIGVLGKLYSDRFDDDGSAPTVAPATEAQSSTGGVSETAGTTQTPRTPASSPAAEVQATTGGIADAAPTQSKPRTSPATSSTTNTRPSEPLPKLVSVPAGCFMMGSPTDEAGRYNDEGPQHKVCLDGFRIGRYEVSFAEYDAFARATDRELPEAMGWGRADRPVIKVSWQDARDYTAWLSTQLESRCGLPSEAQWEYAARAGTRLAYAIPAPDGSSDIRDKALANCRGCGSDWDAESTAPVGRFAPNAWGLHDMHGNVYEWVQDCWHGDYKNAPEDGRPWEAQNAGDCARRVLRGGSWLLNPEHARSAHRRGSRPVDRNGSVGFRVLCSGP